MKTTSAEVGLRMDSKRAVLAEAVTDRHYQLHPELEQRYGERGRQKCREDAAYHLTYLAEALAESKSSVFRDYVAWAKIMLARRGIPARDLADNLKITAEILKDRLPPQDASIACAYLEMAIAGLPQMPLDPPCCIAPNQPFAKLAKSYMAALLACQRREATGLILDAVRNGMSIKDIYIHVFQQSQHEIGRLWQINRITVAQEHYCTAATQMIMSQLYPQIFAGARVGRQFVGVCVGGDLHEIGMRMIADFFEIDGWDTVYLGSNVPSADLIHTLQERQPDVVGISATLTTHIGAVTQIISSIREAPSCRDIKIIVGGHPFNVTPDLWKDVQADGCCEDARGAVELANQLIRHGAAS